MLTVASLAALHGGDTKSEVEPATDRQLIKLMELMAERLPQDLYDEDHLDFVVTSGKQRVSQAIDNLMKRRPIRKGKSVNQYAGICADCFLRVEAREGRLSRADDGRWEVRHREGECGHSDFPFPYGRYAVETDEGHLGFYQALPQGLFVQASDDVHPVPIKSQKAIIDKIAADPQAASIRYGLEIGECGRCGRTLTNEDSRARGIGPECAKKSWA